MESFTVAQLIPRLAEGGAERGVVELNRGFVAAGIRSVVVSNGGGLAAHIGADGGKHLELDIAGKNPITFAARASALHRLLWSEQPDIVHVRSRLPAWLLRFAKRGLDCRVVSTVHGFHSVGRYSAVMTDADKVICPCAALATHVRRHYGVPESKIAVVPRGIDLDAFDPAKLPAGAVEALRAELGLGGGKVVASVGRISPIKGHDLFLRALAEVRRGGTDVQGVIVGSAGAGKKRVLKRLKRLAKELGLTDAVVFADGRPDIATVYALADVVVAASIKPESFGRVVAEAIAMGTPVVAADHGGFSDIVEHGRNGLKSPPKDAGALAKCVAEALSRPWEGLRETIEARYALESMIKRNIEIYREVLSQHA